MEPEAGDEVISHRHIASPVVIRIVYTCFIEKLAYISDYSVG